MNITIKTPEALDIMRQAAKILSNLLKLIESEIFIGQTTINLNNMAIDFLRENDATPSFLNYEGFPYAICASKNNEVVHGFPNDIPLKDGDIISIDAGAFYKGYHSDAARTFGVGNISAEAKRLIEVTKQAFFEGVEGIHAGSKLGNISARVQQCAERNGYSVVRELVGHGIGTGLHEDPMVPNYGKFNGGVVLKQGMVIAVEPMVNLGSKEVSICANDWTVVTKDGKISAHYENTIIICANCIEIITL